MLAKRAKIPKLTTHTFRHLCLTDLARSGWDVHEIARFAGHRSIQSTMTYIHLSGQDLAEKLAQQMNEIHHWRVQEMNEVWS
jgi:integrase